MPKVFGKDVPTWGLGLAVAVLAGLVYSAFGGDDTPVKAVSSTKKTDKKTANSIYTQEDVSGASFAVFTETPKDAFLPAVSKPGPAASSPSGLDASWAGGEPGWAYTGYVVFDGKPQALLENANNGEGTYVSPGQTWKTSTIDHITPDTIVLRTKTGPHNVKLGEGSEHKGGKDVVQPVPPANPAPALTGPIGNLPGVAQQGDPNAPQPDAANAGQMYGGMGRGRRGGFGGGGRGRRGGFGGGGNGGGDGG